VTSPTPVVIDTDVGADPDDALALILALASPEVDVRGVTIVSGDLTWRARVEGCSTCRTEVTRPKSRRPPRSTGFSPHRATIPFISSRSVR
jgi:hypothetical protein